MPSRSRTGSAGAGGGGGGGGARGGGGDGAPPPAPRRPPRRDDLHPLGVEPERGREPARRRRHGVADPLMGDHGGGADGDREAEAIVGGDDGQRFEAGLIGPPLHG